MKQSQLLALALIGTSACQISAQITGISDSVSMGKSYTNAIYYNIQDGTKTSTPVNIWHMAHTTVSRDNCIRLNHMAGVEVYSYPKGNNSAFTNFDTTGYKGWKKFYNDIHTHELGALNQSVNPANMWDFSWGVYDPMTKEVIGDSLYLLVISTTQPTVTRSFYKFMPISQPATGDFIFRYATLDGKTDITDTLLQTNYTGKSYKYFSFASGDVQTEPIRENWDILFTRYFAPTTPPSGGPAVMYPTMGIESKRGARVSKITTMTWDSIYNNAASVKLAIKTIGNAKALSKDLTAIGSDWKSFDQPTNTWSIAAGNNYIVESIRNNASTKDTSFYMLSLNAFSGSSTGNIKFRRTKLSNPVSAVKSIGGANVKLFPNPVQDDAILIINPSFGIVTIELLAMDGKLISTARVDLNQNEMLQLPMSHLKAGMYQVIVKTTTGNSLIHLIKN